MAALPISAYVVLGLLEEQQEATPYQLDQQIQQGIGNFWVFPRSQLYAEAGRLARRGLVVERREETGRRRRTLAITDAGREELRRWLETPTDATTEIHDEGVLRLFFQPLGRGSASTHCNSAVEAVAKLAEEQTAAHQNRLARYRREAESDRLPPGTPQRAALELGLRFEQMISDFWREIRESPADLLAPSREGAEAGD
ncbi:PadR family transcriptional regulator [Streptomyces coffeae]|uniref:Helix-turn-helix transcriptional regulator n=1 Tax=Streptomyces coffeae TaxID=621382 RepID=A0ABS1NC74_9ACTN|nr:PadR family transcriptional regulator [Streptomyces coffeae]MBL1097685.1 helix-turn-helix transcriptional regulator [Streptomyces coffeae]